MFSKFLFISTIVLAFISFEGRKSDLKNSFSSDYVPEISFYGVQVRVNNLKFAIDLYADKMGFQIKEKYKKRVHLLNEGMPLILVEVAQPNNTDFRKESNASIAFLVNDLLPAIDKFRQNKIEILDKDLTRNGVGISIPFKDGAGNEHHLIEVQVYDIPEFKEPKIYNTGFSVSDMKKAEDFYINILGFEVYSRNYLPAALPLKHKDQSFAFMLHHENETLPSKANYPKESQTILVFKTKNLDLLFQYFKEKNVVLPTNRIIVNEAGRYFAFKDPIGNVSEVWEMEE